MDNLSRFWAPAEETIRYDHRGFLAIDERLADRTCSTLELPHAPLSLLLGPPRSGKTTEILGLDHAHGYHNIDLRYVLPRSAEEEFKVPKSPPQALVLDSLDEFAAENPVAELRHLLRPWIESRIRVFLACRAAEVPLALDEAFGSGGPIPRFQLLPLTWDQAEKLSRAFLHVRSDDFIQQLAAVNLGSFPSLPGNLRLLIEDFKSNGWLEPDLQKLWARTFERLVGEQSTTKEDCRRKKGGILSSAELLEVARRLAARMMLTDEHSMWIGAPGARPAGCLPSSQAELRVAQTALFQVDAQHQARFAHRSFEQLLAAQAIANSAREDDEIIQVLTDRVTGLHVPARLTEVAAWVSGYRPGVKKWLIQNRPEVLLLSDARIVDPQTRAELVESVFKSEAGDRDSLFWSYPGAPSLLYHDDLVPQATRLWSECHTAKAKENLLDLLHGCGQQAVAGFCVTALETENDQDLRRRSAFILSRMGVGEHGTKLAVLLNSMRVQDGDTHVAARLLQALWPQHLSVTEVLRWADPWPSYDDFDYLRKFFDGHFASGLSADACPEALRWLRDRSDDWYDSPGTYRSALAAEIMRKGFESIQDEATGELFVAVMITRHARNEPAFPNHEQLLNPLPHPLGQDAKGRQRLLELLIGRNETRESPLNRFGIRVDFVATTEDLEFILDSARRSEPALRVRWLRTLRWMLMRSPEQLPKAYALRDRIHGLGRMLRWFEGSWPLRGKRSSYKWHPSTSLDGRASEHQQQMAAWRAERQSRIENLTGALAKLEADLEAGNVNVWWALYVMQCGPDGHFGTPRYRLDELPGWGRISDNAIEALIGGFPSFIRDCTNEPISPDDHLAHTSLYMTLLKLHERGTLESLDISAERLHRLAIPFGEASWFACNQVTERIHVAFRDSFYKSNPEMALVYAKWRLRNRQSLLDFQIVDNVNDERLWSLYLTALATADVSDLVFPLADLSPERRDLLRPLVLNALPKGIPRREARIRALAVRLWFATRRNWIAFRDVRDRYLSSSPSLSKALIDTIHQDDRHLVANSLDLDFDDLSALADWLGGHAEPLAMRHGYCAVTAGRTASDLRGQLLQKIAKAGTLAAIEFIEGQVRKHPKWSLDFYLRLAHDEYWNRSSTLTDEQACAFLDGSKSVILNGPRDLHILLVSLLKQIRIEWTEPGMGALLWDKGGRKTKPEPETVLRDIVYRELKHRLKSIGCLSREEALMNRGETDILVKAWVESRHGPVELQEVIEVKCSWNSGLDTDPEVQLADRYMTGPRSHYGIFLTGHFEHPEWDVADSRRDKSRRRFQQGQIPADQKRQFDGKEILLFGIDCRL